MALKILWPLKRLAIRAGYADPSLIIARARRAHIRLVKP